MSDDKSDKTKHEIIFKLVDETILKNPKDWPRRLEDIGFTWVGDGEDPADDQEKSVQPKTLDQEFLVAYFDGHIKLSGQVLKSYFNEKYSDDPNDPLFKKYFKQGNLPLKRLLQLGLDKDPCDVALLDDLGFMNRFGNCLSEVISRYLDACDKVPGMECFKETARDFYFNTVEDGYDALHELKRRFSEDPERSVVVWELVKEVEEASKPVRF